MRTVAMRWLWLWVLGGAVLAATCAPAWAAGQKTVVQDTLVRADGSAAAGTLVISWPAFTSADGQAVAAGSMTVKIGAGGAVSIPLIANTGSQPASAYKVTLKLMDGSTSEEQWVVPALATTTIAAVRAKTVPAAVAQQFVGRDYFDTKLAQVNSGAQVTAPNTWAAKQTFAVAPTVPSPATSSDAANRAYVDSVAGTKADDAAVVHTTRVESIAGQKTFAEAATFAAGITGTGSTGALALGSGALNAANTFTQTQTFDTAVVTNCSKVWTTHDVRCYAGDDIGQKIQACITAMGNTRGTCDARALAPVWPATANMSGFVCSPGNTVLLGNGTYLVTSTIYINAGCNFYGNLGHPNGEGTVLKAANGLNADVVRVVDLGTSPSGNWAHWVRIQGLHLDGNKANQTTGHCLAVMSPLGEPSAIRDVQIANCKVDGYYVTGVGQATGYLERVSAFSNGRYGFNFDDVGGTNKMTSLGGDDNGAALVHVKGEQSLVLKLDDLKAESKSAGVQPDILLLEGVNGTPTITVNGATANAVASSTTNFAHIINGSVNLSIRDAWLDFTDITNVIQDDARAMTVPMSLYTTPAGHVPEITHYGTTANYITGGTAVGLLFGNQRWLGWQNGSGVTKSILRVNSGNAIEFQNAGAAGIQGKNSGGTQVWTVDDAGKGTFNGGVVPSATSSTLGFYGKSATGNIGGSSLSPNACASGTATVSGATTSMTATAAPATYPGDGFVWKAYVSANDTVTVKVCTGSTSGTPAASVYQVRVVN